MDTNFKGIMYFCNPRNFTWILRYDFDNHTGQLRGVDQRFIDQNTTIECYFANSSMENKYNFEDNIKSFVMGNTGTKWAVMTKEQANKMIKEWWKNGI